MNNYSISKGINIGRTMYSKRCVMMMYDESFMEFRGKQAEHKLLAILP